MNWIFLLVLFGVALLFCIMGFKKMVWFLSIGYGLSICGLGLAGIAITLLNQFLSTGILGLPQYDLSTNALPFVLILAQSLLMVIYGFRLGGFILIRELKSSAYNKEVSGVVGKEPPMFVKVVMWLCVGVLYVAEAAGLVFRMEHATTDFILPIIGILISIIGVILEAVGDAQKSAQKKENPKMVATKGLYKMCRCPNYFGEILFWTGTFISGILAYQSFGEWLIAILAYISIVYIMFNGAKRLEKRQQTRLKDNQEYIEYANKTPIIIPLIPLYHLYDEEKEKAKEAKRNALKKSKKEENK